MFFALPNIISVHLPEVTEIGNRAFMCDMLRSQYSDGHIYGVEPKLTSISLPKCVRAGAEAFRDRPTLCDINMPLLQECGEGIFSCVRNTESYVDKCTLTSLSLPSLTAIPGYMLAGQDALVKVSFPKVTCLCAYAFEDCYLTSFDFSNIEKVQSFAFFRSNFKDISISNASFHNSSGSNMPTDYLFGESRQLTSVTLPLDLSVIGTYMFEDCEKLSNVIIDFSKIHCIGDMPFRRYNGTVIPYAA